MSELTKWFEVVTRELAHICPNELFKDVDLGSAQQQLERLVLMEEARQEADHYGEEIEP